MATLRNKKKLAALNMGNCGKHLRSYLAQKPNVPRSQEDYITQVSAEIQRKVTKKFSQEFIKTKNRILATLLRLDGFLMIPLTQATPQPLQRPAGTHVAETRERMRTIPRVMFILNQASFRAGRYKTLAKTIICFK